MDEFDELDAFAGGGDCASGPLGDLDDVFAIEEREMAAGYAEGVVAAQEESHAEGARRGAEAGFALGHEAGFYAACVVQWRRWAALPQRASAALAALERALRRLPFDARDEALQGALGNVRARFRQACAAVGVDSATCQPPHKADIGGTTDHQSF